MIHLVWYFLLKSGSRKLLLMCLFPVAATLFVIWQWQFNGDSDVFASLGSTAPLLMINVLMCWLPAADIWQGEEFDLALPFRRRTIFVAKNLTTLLILALFAAPLSAVAVASAQGRQWETMLFCANLLLGWAAILIMSFPIFRVVKRMPPLLAVPAGVVSLGGMCCLLIAALITGKPGLLIAVSAVALGALSWILGMRQYERFELVPNTEGGTFPFGGFSATGPDGIQGAEPRSTGQTAAAYAAILDRFSPFVRVMFRALWFRWWYALAVLLMAVLTAWVYEYPVIILWLVLYPGSLLARIFKEAGNGLLPFVRRQTIFRCILAPMLGGTLVSAAIATIRAAAPDRIVVWLAVLLLSVFSVWAVLPSAKEQAKASRLRERMFFPLFLLCVFLPSWISSGRGGLRHLHAELISDIYPRLFGDLWFLSCAMVLAIALLWWRCERKFRQYEPAATPRGPADAG